MSKRLPAPPPPGSPPPPGQPLRPPVPPGAEDDDVLDPKLDLDDEADEQLDDEFDATDWPDDEPMPFEDDEQLLELEEDFAIDEDDDEEDDSQTVDDDEEDISNTDLPDEFDDLHPELVVVPWKTTAHLPEHDLDLPAILDATAETSTWVGGPGGLTQVSIAGLAIEVQLIATQGPTAQITLGRDAISGRLLVQP